MSYLAGAYAFGLLALAGYAVSLYRRSRAVAARLRELQDPAGRSA